jgi:serine/threonine protein phosphatase PrpC
VNVRQRAGETNAGRKRRRNEDAFVCDPPLFAVADGMGGAQAGEVASSLAAAALRERGDGADHGGEEGVAELIQEANRRVHQRALDDETASGMGTTITVALLQPDGSVSIGHVGDSRAYLLREARLEQLTDDHSLVAELVRRGELSPEEAEVHPQRSVITRALGTDPDVDVDTFTLQARDGDVFLLCSDGLTTMVDVGTIASVIERNRGDLAAAARALIREANDRGGDDNITAVLFEVAEGDPDEATVEATVPVTAPEDEDTLHPGEVPAPAGLADGDTSILSLDELQRAHAAAQPAAGEAEPEAADPPLPIGRLVAATLVIVALAALILVLVFRGLAR